MALFVKAEECIVHLGHHSPPSNDIRLTIRPSSLLKINQRLQQAIQVIIRGIVDLLEGSETFGQICTDPWCVIIAKGALVQMEIVAIIVGEIRDFLIFTIRLNLSIFIWNTIERRILVERSIGIVRYCPTLGLRIAALEPANWPTG